MQGLLKNFECFPESLDRCSWNCVNALSSLHWCFQLLSDKSHRASVSGYYLGAVGNWKNENVGWDPWLTAFSHVSFQMRWLPPSEATSQGWKSRQFC